MSHAQELLTHSKTAMLAVKMLPKTKDPRKGIFSRISTKNEVPVVLPTGTFVLALT